MNCQPIRHFIVILVSFAGSIAFAADEPAAAEPPKPTSPPKATDETMEKKFSAMLKGATLRGTWAPMGQVGLGEDIEDGYHIVRAVKQDGDRWVMVSRFNYKGQQMDIPIPVVIKFAGDVAVMILDDVPVGEGKTWSARILFHDDVYAGSWWGAKKEEGGILSGVITRGEEKKE